MICIRPVLWISQAVYATLILIQPATTHHSITYTWYTTLALKEQLCSGRLHQCSASAFSKGVKSSFYSNRIVMSVLRNQVRNPVVKLQLLALPDWTFTCNSEAWTVHMICKNCLSTLWLATMHVEYYARSTFRSPLSRFIRWIKSVDAWYIWLSGLQSGSELWKP
jgi:hypothetical protein